MKDINEFMYWGTICLGKACFITCQIHVSFFTDPLLSGEIFLEKKDGFVADPWSNLWFMGVIVLS